MDDTPAARVDAHTFEVQLTKLEHEHEHGRIDCQKLDSYQAALRLQALVPQLSERCGHSLRDQLERAAASVLLNTAEGCGRRARRDRARFYSMARGSAMECVAIVDLLGVRDAAPLVARRQAHSLLHRIVSMLTRMERRARQR